MVKRVIGGMEVRIYLVMTVAIPQQADAATK
jgi:hypothetical protein